MNKTQIVYNKPIYLGKCIIDISKILMYEFHYKYMKPKYGDNLELLFTDTDSLCYETKTEDFYKDIADDVEARFDTSEYPKGHPAVVQGFKVGCNKKVIGIFKGEASGKQITEFVGLRAKCYAITINNTDTKKCKGTKKGVVKKLLTIDDYRQCAYDHKPKLLSMNTIHSQAQVVQRDHK
jgi:hypothetical protein